MDAVPLTTTQRQRVAALIGNCSIELSPRDELAGEALRRLLDPGTSVFVNHPPSVTHHDIVAACARLRRAGFVPVPHVAARRLASRWGHGPASPTGS
jgi:methylenetetrahydrofolate reductase (NADPH)